MFGLTFLRRLGIVASNSCLMLWDMKLLGKSQPPNQHPTFPPSRPPSSQSLRWDPVRHLTARFQQFSAIIFPGILPQALCYLFTYAGAELLTMAQ